jgi:hypothetical protein
VIRDPGSGIGIRKPQSRIRSSVDASFEPGYDAKFFRIPDLGLRIPDRIPDPGSRIGPRIPTEFMP